ncbi:splicing factor U2af large subunit B-like [Impatiens glandulifera]|uniref:splicing factor U2af large subunit B-like n=1 Tax=Impatiens glandulifera TaxID=253017 RepID=UPI001FB0CF66|nr:splicing factor U2af large subunit B-like [Impatiens glandulifera]
MGMVPSTMVTRIWECGSTRLCLGGAEMIMVVEELVGKILVMEKKRQRVGRFQRRRKDEREKDNEHENDFSERRHGGSDMERDRDCLGERSRDRDRNMDREREKEHERGDRHRRDDMERHDNSSIMYKERESERGGDNDDEWKKSSRLTRPQSKCRMSHEDDQRSSRSQDTNYAKRRH